MDSTKKIWVLGAKSYNADKRIGWDSEYPNFSDQDILIINLCSLTMEVLERIEKKYIQIRQSILNRYSHGGIIIFVTAPRFTMRKHPGTTGTTLGGVLSNWFLSHYQ
jgi:hypothetical protein